MQITLQCNIKLEQIQYTVYTNASRGTANGALGTLIASITSTGISTANAQISGTVSAATLVGSLFSGGSIGVAGATVGTLYANTITVGNLYVSGSTISMNITTVNLIDTNISTGTLNVTNGITSSSLTVSGASVLNGGITTGNINFTGNLYQNGAAYSPPSQWTTTNGNVSYTSGSVVTGTVSASNTITTNFTINGTSFPRICNAVFQCLYVVPADNRFGYNGISILQNNGGGLSAPLDSSGIFYCRYSGVYTCTVTFTPSPFNNQTRVYLYRNGSQFHSTTLAWASNSCATGAVTLYCSAGDYLYFYLQGGGVESLYNGNNIASFALLC